MWTEAKRRKKYGLNLLMSVLFRWCTASLPSTSQLEPSTSPQSQLLDASCVHSHRLYGNLASDLVRRAFAPPVEVSKAPCEGMVLVDLVQWTKSQDSFKTFQNNQNRREAIELKFSCALCQQALEPSVFQGGNPPKGLETIETASRRTASHCPFFRLWSLSPRRTGIEARSILVREKFWQTKSKQAKHSKLRRTRHEQNKWHWRNKT